MAERVREIEPINTGIIYVGDRLRHVTDEAIALMAESMGALGLLEPVSVRIVDDLLLDGAPADGVPVLIAGATRLAAAKKLGWAKIDCVVADVDEVQARRREIAENLHRTELTVQEHSEHVAEWIRLSSPEVSGQVARKPEGGRPVGGLSAAAREIGVERTDARRAVKIASITPEAKEAARDAGLDDNQSALLKVAKAEPSRQLSVVAEIAEAKATKLDTDIKNRAAEEMAEAIVEHMPHVLHGMMKENAWVCAKPLAIALTNLLGGAIMDKGAA